MKKYKIKYRATFEGFIDVLAESKQEAKKIVHAGFSTPYLEVGHNHTWMSEDKDESGIVDWDFDIHATKIDII